MLTSPQRWGRLGTLFGGKLVSYGKADCGAEMCDVPEALPLKNHAEDARIVVVDPSRRMSSVIKEFCRFLDLQSCLAETGDDLGLLLEEARPIALVCAVEPGGPDGFTILKRVAVYDATLPVLLVTREHDGLRYFEMIEESWGLTSVLKTRDLPPPRMLMEFLSRAGLKSGRRRLIPS
ncbi:MAG: hypothetical protein JO264_17245 [Acidisphaera sp.]|nr:hypothetical protein [Acidisphaera sp.]